jgi:hypothetical protein
MMCSVPEMKMDSYLLLSFCAKKFANVLPSSILECSILLEINSLPISEY